MKGDVTVSPDFHFPQFAVQFLDFLVLRNECLLQFANAFPSRIEHDAPENSILPVVVYMTPLRPLNTMGLPDSEPAKITAEQL